MKAFKTITALSLALLVLVSSTSFQVGLHFCKGEVQEVALFAKAPGCEKEKQLPPCHRQTKSSCCDDETVIHEADELATSLESLNVDVSNLTDASHPFVLVAEIIPSSSVSRHPYIHYQPPLRSGDLTVAYRSFII